MMECGIFNQYDGMILAGICLTFILLLSGSFLLYRYLLGKTKDSISQGKLVSLMLRQEDLEKEKRIAEMEREREALKAENMRLKLMELERERDSLEELAMENCGLDNAVREVVRKRLDMLNGLIAKEISGHEMYAKPYHDWIGSVLNDKHNFMNSTRLAFTASYPRFISCLNGYGLTDDEINYACLYAIGLRGKEIGEYLRLKRHYNISSAIRKKLGLDTHSANIGPYIRKLMAESCNDTCSSNTIL